MKQISTYLLCIFGLLFFGLSVNPVQADVVTTYFHNDIFGTPMVATDVSGNLLWKETYRPYGERILNKANPNNNKIWFGGKSQDPNTGLSYFGARYYNPQWGRFTSIDPKEVEPGDLYSFNRYAYANNNPYKYIDPDGANAVTAFGGLLTESYNLLSGGDFNGAAVWGALKDGYNGEGAGVLDSAVEDALAFGGGVVGAVGKLSRLVKAGKSVERVVGSIRNVNPTKGMQNCTNCSIATDATLAGRPASALPGGPTSIRALEKYFGGRFGSAISRSGIEDQMLNAGSGARGIVFGSRGSEIGHVFNVVTQQPPAQAGGLCITD